MEIVNANLQKRIPQLDGLRGVAIALVLAFHYLAFANQYGAPWIFRPLFWTFSLGWSGVDLFFVLSGFLIGRILLEARDSTNYFRAFYMRRICRIFPLYGAFLAAAALVSRHWPILVPWHLCFLFLQNFWMAAHNTAAGGTVHPSWSLAVEEQFYVTLPAVIYFVKPRHLPKVLLGGIVASPLFRVAFFVSSRNSGMATMVLLPCRMDSLLIGVATAWLMRQPAAIEKVRARRQQLWTAIEILSAGCLVSFLFESRDNLLTNLGLYDCFALLFACVIIASLTEPRVAAFLQGRWLRGLGNISYGVYLFHSIAFVVALSVLPAMRDRGVAAAAVGLALTMGVCKLSWEYFEKPIIRLGHRTTYSREQATAAVPAPAVALAE